VRLGYDVTEGEDIVTAVKGICGTSVANIEPNRSSEKKKKLEYQIGMNFGGQLKVNMQDIFVLALYQILENGKTFHQPLLKKQWIIEYKKNLHQHYLITPFQILNG
jgi:hypothetical protein